MIQLHKKFTGEPVKVLFSAYEAGHLSRIEVENTLGISKTHFFVLLKQFRDQLDAFSIAYQVATYLSAGLDEKIWGELQR